MTRNGFHRAARLASHPACAPDLTGLLCPVCGERLGRVSEYDRHFLGHNPGPELAFQYMSAGSYDKLWRKRGWDDPAVLLAAFGGGTGTVG